MTVLVPPTAAWCKYFLYCCSCAHQPLPPFPLPPSLIFPCRLYFVVLPVGEPPCLIRWVLLLPSRAVSKVVFCVPSKSVWNYPTFKLSFHHRTINSKQISLVFFNKSVHHYFFRLEAMISFLVQKPFWHLRFVCSSIILNKLYL